MNSEYFIKLDYRCNNQCRFCITAEHHSYLKFDEIINIIDKIDKEQFNIVTISGGEPTLRKDIIKILQYIKQEGFKIRLQTNARKFANFEFAEAVANIGIESYLVSFHEYRKEPFEYITQQDGSFDETIQGIKNIKLFKQYVISNTVINKYNYKFLKEIAEKVLALGVDEIKYVLLRSVEQDKRRYNEFSISFQQLNPYLNQALEYVKNMNKEALVEGIPFCQIENLYESVGELYIPSRLDFASKDEKRKNIDYGFMFYGKSDKCNKCNFNDICSGTWEEYLEKYGDKELRPIQNKNISDMFDINILVNKMFI